MGCGEGGRRVIAAGAGITGFLFTLTSILSHRRERKKDGTDLSVRVVVYSPDLTVARSL